MCQNKSKPDNHCRRCECKKGYTNPSGSSNDNQLCQCLGAEGEILLHAYNDVVVETVGKFLSQPLVMDKLRAEMNQITNGIDGSGAIITSGNGTPSAKEKELWQIMREVYNGILDELIPKQHTNGGYIYQLEPTFTKVTTATAPSGTKSTLFSFTIPYGCPESNQEWTKLEHLATSWDNLLAKFTTIPAIEKYFKTDGYQDCSGGRCTIEPGKPLVPSGVGSGGWGLMGVVVVVVLGWVVFGI